MKKILFFILVPVLAFGQTQIGADINGEAAVDVSGWSVSLSSDGTVLAIGAIHYVGNGPSSGHVRIYKNISGTWTQVGVDINGEAAGDQSGTSVSLSSDGSVVAIGAPLNDGNNTSSGHVRIYKNISGTWTQVAAINGEAASDWSGYRVSLSSDGSVVAIGASQNDGNGASSGHVRIYKNISGTWTQVGVAINGDAAGDSSGVSVSLSSNGSVVAIGAPYNSGNGSFSGHVRVYNLAAVLSSDSFVSSNFSIYPNPTSEILTISLNDTLQLDKVNIYNTLGQLVQSDKKNVITISTLAKGNYFVEVITNQGKATKTIIVE